MPSSLALTSIALRDLPTLEVVLGLSPKMTVARGAFLRVARTNVPVLLEGEAGTGKEIFARLLHAYSEHSRSPWLNVSCPELVQSLIVSHSMEHEKRAWSHASASSAILPDFAQVGTLFLDNIDTLHVSLQKKLLHFLQDATLVRAGQTRLVSASRDNLQQRAAIGTFQRDLLFRINAVTINIPPLRQRIQDISMLAGYFLDKYSQKFGRTPRPLSDKLLRLMQSHSWPGNIRQLENVMRTYVLNGNDEAAVAILTEHIHHC